MISITSGAKADAIIVLTGAAKVANPTAGVKDNLLLLNSSVNFTL